MGTHYKVNIILFALFCLGGKLICLWFEFVWGGGGGVTLSGLVALKACVLV